MCLCYMCLLSRVGECFPKTRRYVTRGGSGGVGFSSFVVSSPLQGLKLYLQISLLRWNLAITRKHTESCGSRNIKAKEALVFPRFCHSGGNTTPYAIKNQSPPMELNNFLSFRPTKAVRGERASG